MKIEELIEGLEERFTKEERDALAAAKGPGGMKQNGPAPHWSADVQRGRPRSDHPFPQLQGSYVWDNIGRSVAMPHGDDKAVYMAYWDPAHVLAEVAAKRRVTEVARLMLADEGRRAEGETILRALAEPYLEIVPADETEV